MFFSRLKHWSAFGRDVRMTEVCIADQELLVKSPAEFLVRLVDRCAANRNLLSTRDPTVVSWVPLSYRTNEMAEQVDNAATSACKLGGPM